MTIRTPQQALAVANGTRVNIEGMCQAVTRGYYNGPSAGDVDHDGDSDAYDGWLSEPTWAKHIGDRNPPAGYPVAFKNRHGHRAISLGGGRIRSTDFDGLTKRYRPGVLGNGTIAEVEAAMNVVYLGWSETIDGAVIPKDAPPPPPAPPVEKPQEDPMLAKARALVLRIKNSLNDPKRHLVDLDDLNALIELGHQPEALAAKDFRNQIQAGAKSFGEEVKW